MPGYHRDLRTRYLRVITHQQGASYARWCEADIDDTDGIGQVIGYPYLIVIV